MDRRVAAPLVSVVIPTFNRGDLLPRAILSVQRQTYLPWELIVVDDGSTDGTADWLAERATELRWIRQPNRGVGAARNAGIAAARGDLISMLDSDDEYLPDHLSSRVEILTSGKLDLLAGGIIVDGNPLTVDFFHPEQLVDLRSCVVGGSLFGRAEVFRELAGFNAEAFGEDTDFWQRAEARFRTRLLHEPASYVLHETPDSLRLRRMADWQNR